MPTDKLGIYNGALLHLEERKLASLAEAREPRRALDDAWDDAVDYCLEQGLWNFAMRSVQIESSPSVDPTFGFTYAFTKPDDWVRTADISESESLDPPLLHFKEEAGYWYADCDPLYVRYVSNDNSYGRDIANWPMTFAAYVALRLAVRTCRRITGSDNLTDRLEKREDRARADARSKDAMNESVQFPPVGSWVRSRGFGLQRSRWDRRS